MMKKHMLPFVALALLIGVGGAVPAPAFAQDQDQQARKQAQQMRQQQRQEQQDKQMPAWRGQHSKQHQIWNRRRNEGADTDDQLLVTAQNALQMALSDLRSGNRSGAQQALNTAITNLRNGQREYGGHRAIAMGDAREALKILNSRYRERSSPIAKIQLALDQIKLALAWDRQHPG